MPNGNPFSKMLYSLPVDPRTNMPVPDNGPENSYAPWLAAPSVGLRVGPYTGGDPGKQAAADREWEAMRAKYAGMQEKAGGTPYAPPPGMVGGTGAHPGFLDPWGYPVDEGQPPQMPELPIGAETIVRGVEKMANPIASLYGDIAHLIPTPTGLEGQSFYPPSAMPPQPAPSPEAAPSPSPASPEEAPAPETASPGAAVSATVVAAGGPPLADADTAAPDTLENYVQFVKKLYGDRPTYNPAQDRADKNAESEKTRTKLLAQLAFAGGLTAAGGGSWKAVGAGFTDAAAVYGAGFKRYQDALQDSADRYQKSADQDYRTDVAAKSDALSLYSADKKDARTRAEKRAEKMQDSLDDMYKKEMDAAKSDLGSDPNTIKDIMRRWNLSKQAGEYIGPVENVSDT